MTQGWMHSILFMVVYIDFLCTGGQEVVPEVSFAGHAGAWGAQEGSKRKAKATVDTLLPSERVDSALRT